MHDDCDYKNFSLQGNIFKPAVFCWWFEISWVAITYMGYPILWGVEFTFANFYWVNWKSNFQFVEIISTVLRNRNFNKISLTSKGFLTLFTVFFYAIWLYNGKDRTPFSLFLGESNPGSNFADFFARVNSTPASSLWRMRWCLRSFGYFLSRDGCRVTRSEGTNSTPIPFNTSSP